jgi:hypothetical protein
VPPAPNGLGVFGLEDIVTGPDGELWFTESLNSAIGQAVFVTSELVVSPPIGTSHTELTFTGSGFAPNETVRIYSKGVGSHVLARGTTDTSGSFTAMAHAPESPYGHRIFLGTGQISGDLGAASFSVAARLILSPASGAIGSTATVAGYGFGALEMVKVFWNDPRAFLGTVTTDVNGTFSGSAALGFTVPAGSGQRAQCCLWKR